MSDTDDDASSFRSGYVTPPLSPTKTISTEGCFSPRTPGSPRKSRVCLFPRDVDDDAEHPFFTPPASPTKSKSKSGSFHSALIIPEVLHASNEVIEPHSDDDSPVKRQSTTYARRLFPSGSPTFTDVHDLSAPEAGQSLLDLTELPHAKDERDVVRDTPLRHTRKSSHRSLSDSLLELPDAKYLTTEFDSHGVTPEIESAVHLFVGSDNSPSNTLSEQLRRFPLRHASSPLRPSQWAARGGSLRSPRKGQCSTPDRFIACRRPPTVTRQSYELNKPSERLEVHETGRGSRPNTDAFSRRLRRSGRLNDELRGLREAHSMIVGRASAHRRNAILTYRHSSLGSRQVSAGAVWNVGGPSAVSDTVIGVSTGRGGMLGSGTNAPLYRSSFLNRADPEAELEAHERRIALALDVDQADRILQHSPEPSHNEYNGGRTSNVKHAWRDGAWIKDSITPFLDAPQLRDDYYCTLLAYSHTAKCLAVGLGNFVHLWSERSGVDTPESLNAVPAGSAALAVQHVTSLDFSSIQGAQAILAVGRADGRISLWSPFDSEPRFDAAQPKPVSCVSWRPTTVQRPSLRDRAVTVATEELLIGDEVGHIYFYSIEWPSETQSALFGWHGAMTLLARMTIHTQQICGLAWAPDGELFASGGNDNNCFLFETKKMLRQNNSSGNAAATLDMREGPGGESIYTVSNRASPVLQLPHTASRHKWTLNAAVKAMAFCPWQTGLIAIGGGSNDRCIHFYHTRSGTCLATIDCAAQVTSLVWSQTRREIAATFGFTQPEHPYRVAVFAWPSCEQVVAVPWWDENRALCAVAYPGSPSSGAPADEGPGSRSLSGADDIWPRRGVRDGCIVVAASDMAIRFHEIWSDKGGSSGVGRGTVGLLGGSDILEGLHGIAREGAVIR